MRDIEVIIKVRGKEHHRLSLLDILASFEHDWPDRPQAELDAVARDEWANMIHKDCLDLANRKA